MAVNVFLELSDGIKGESQDVEHKDKIDIHSWSWGLSNSGTGHQGSGSGGGKLSVQDIGFTKVVDLATNDLIQRCANGFHIATGTLTVCKAGGETPVPYLIIDLEHILVTNYSTGGSADQTDRVMESFTLNFKKFKVNYLIQDNTGASGTGSGFGWDIPGNVAT